ncbi:hypothetical protein XENTR_v10001342 [Xenopus tropicalis]|nr:hypothetical protein XENTR_v10001342 [Xenopus tropicalis]
MTSETQSLNDSKAFVIFLIAEVLKLIHSIHAMAISNSAAERKVTTEEKALVTVTANDWIITDDVLLLSIMDSGWG